MTAPTLQQEVEFELAKLVADHPPLWRHPHKKAIHELVCREGGAVSGTMRYTRWKLAPLGDTMQVHPVELVARSGFFTYPASHPGIWHLNFADSRLFAAYGSALMAQDEWQVAEHPMLGSLREALLYEEHPALTREDGISTPVLVTDVPRQCRIDLANQSQSKGGGFQAFVGKLLRSSPRPLYGNAFAAASLEEVLRITWVLRPAPLTNILAISAPTGSGAYTVKQITDVLQTAYSGFAAALIESKRRGVPPRDVEINTGWWGCGAFGGNRVLTAMLQILVAKFAGIGRLCFYIGAEAERFSFDEARDYADSLLTDHGGNITKIIQTIHHLAFTWGQSDGN